MEFRLNLDQPYRNSYFDPYYRRDTRLYNPLLSSISGIIIFIIFVIIFYISIPRTNNTEFYIFVLVLPLFIAIFGGIFIGNLFPPLQMFNYEKLT